MIKNLKLFKKKIPDKVWTWFIFGVLLVVVLQLFWVLRTYYILESGKLMRWMLIYFSIPFLGGSFFLLNTFNRHLFYNYPEYYSEKYLSKWSKFKNKLTSYVLLVAAFSLFTCNTIIQTNDWFGSAEQIWITNRSIERVEVKYSSDSRRSSRRSWGRLLRSSSKGSYTSDIQISYHGEVRKIRAEGDWNGRETLNIALNTGGFWGILYARSLRS